MKPYTFSTWKNRSFGSLGILAAICGAVAFGTMSDRTAWAGASPVVVYACGHKNGSIRLIPSPDKCDKANETLLGALPLERLAAVVPPAGDSALPGSRVQLSNAHDVAAVIFNGDGDYCVFPSNPAFDFDSLSRTPAVVFVRPTPRGANQANANASVGPVVLCLAPTGAGVGPLGIWIRVSLGKDANGQPLLTNNVGFIIEIP
jgi:hypothetical protein